MSDCTVLSPDHETGGASLIDEILSCEGPHSVVPRVLAPLCAATGADSAVALTFHRRPGEVEIDASWACGLPDRCQQAYQHDFFRRDPMVRDHLMRAFDEETVAARPKPIAFNDICAVFERVDDAYLDGFWRAYGFQSLIGVTFRPGDQEDVRTVVGLHRSAGARPFDDAELARVGDAATAIRAAFTLLEEKDARLGAEELAGALLSQWSDCGVAVLRPDGTLRRANEAATAHWAGEAGRAAGVASAFLRGDAFLRTTSEDGAAVECLIHRPDDAEASGGVVVSRPTERGRLLRRHCAALGLSRRETELALLVLDGLSNAEIASLLNISIRTVENHIHSIFNKAGVDSRMRLSKALRTFDDI
ncbi:MAG: LuxR C-terminal-related transcriptional regulator [Pseudomonadota bacterium]